MARRRSTPPPADRPTITHGRIRLGEIVIDNEIYPRQKVDHNNIAHLRRALQADPPANLPEIILEKNEDEKKNNRVIDGVHRTRARILVQELTDWVDVEWRDYSLMADPHQAVLKDAVQLNAKHGQRLNGVDSSRAILMLRHVHVSEEEIAALINTTHHHVHQLALRYVTTPEDTPAGVPGNRRRLVVKRCVAHLQGTQISTIQAGVHSVLPGTNFRFIIRQIREALAAGLLDLHNPQLRMGLRNLRTELVPLNLDDEPEYEENGQNGQNGDEDEDEEDEGNGESNENG